MNQRIRFFIFVLILILVVCIGCSATPTTAAPVKVDKLTVTFEPGKCIYDGPKLISQGEVIVTFKNTTRSIANLDIRKFTEGKIWQDLVDIFKEKNQGIGAPTWLSEVSFKPNLADNSIMTYNFEPGLYAIGCGEILTGSWAMWLGSQLEVR